MLVTGASGLLGANFVVAAAGTHRVIAIANTHSLSLTDVLTERIDLRVRGALGACLERHRPDFVVHFAALTDVDRCETMRDEAYDLNVRPAREISDWARLHDVAVVFMSTDSLFDGTVGHYDENAPTRPLTHYAATKLEAESIVRADIARHLIVRGCFYGWGPQTKQSLGEWVVARLRANLVVPGYRDAIFSPLLANTLAQRILALCDRGSTGTFHVGSRDCMSKFAFAGLLAEHFGLPGELVHPTELAVAGRDARRPLNTSLNVAKVTAELGVEMPTIRDDVRSFHALERSGYSDRIKNLATTDPLTAPGTEASR